MVVLVLELEVIMNHIGINDKDMMGSSVGSFDGMTYEKTCGIIYRKSFGDKDGCRDGGIMMLSMKLKSRHRRGFNLT